MLKLFSTVLFIVLAGTLFGQGGMISIAYEGGMITHPGASVGYYHQICKHNAWALQGGIKLGFYHHKNYQTAVFLTPLIEALHINSKGTIWGVDFAAGPQRTWIPNSYKIDNAGKVMRDRAAGMMQFVFTPGIRFGKDISEKRMLPIQWFINPQLQFRRPESGRMEKYFLMGVGFNYKL